MCVRVCEWVKGREGKGPGDAVGKGAMDGCVYVCVYVDNREVK